MSKALVFLPGQCALYFASISSTQAMFQSHAGTGSSSPNESPSAQSDGYKALRGEAGGEKSKHRRGRHVDMHVNMEQSEFIKMETCLPSEKVTE